MLQFLNEHPTKYLDEIADYLLDAFGVQASTAALYRSLERAKWTRKTARKRAAERDEILRAVWRGKQIHWPIELLVALDESATNERTGWRKYGWAPRGIEVSDIQSAQRSERWSVLPALTVDGYLPGTLIHQGSINAEMFIDWIRDIVLPQVRIRSIFILDNASIHRGQRLRELIEDAGCRMEFLPPYSPDFNPIEESFSTLKAWVKRNVALAANFTSFGAFMVFAVEEGGGRSARAQFKHCGYAVRD